MYRKRRDTNIHLEVYRRYEKEKANTFSPKLTQLRRLSEKDKNRTFDNLTKLVADESLLMNCFEKLRPNRGSLTPGTDEKTIDATELKQVQEISEQIRNGTYEFGSSRRIYVEKPGKTKKRPITIPNFRDRLVQDSIRTVLESIYEPLFQEINVNFGFRPGKGCHEAIEKIVKEGKGAHYAIEGDIEGAYDNVNHDLFFETLGKKIKDKKLTKLIRKLFKSGIMEGDIQSENTLGIPQGGIASPLFFNIILHEVDKEVLEHLKGRTALENQRRGKRLGRNKEHVFLGKRIGAYRQGMKRAFYTYKSMMELKQDEKKWSRFRAHRKNEIKNMKLRMKMSSVSKADRKIRATYTRYADDWILLTNWDANEAMSLKREIGLIIWKKTRLRISEEKTKVTNLTKEPARFLGFTISNTQRMAKPRTVITNRRKFRARPSLNLFIGIDSERVLTRMKLKNITDRDGRARRNTLLIHLKDHEIVEKYAQMMQGLLNYYVKWITFKSQLNRYHDLLKRSCLHTLASRKRSTLRKIIKMFGESLRVEYAFQKVDGTYRTSVAEFPTYLVAMKRAVLVSRRHRPNHDFMNIRVNLRTAYKLSSVCCICGTTGTRSNPIQSHHVRHIHKGRVVNFTKEIMRRLGKRQIVCCKACHVKIHRGEYDNMKLSDLADPDLAMV